MMYKKSALSSNKRESLGVSRPFFFLRYFFYYLVGFSLFYIDGIESNDGLSIGQLWKFPVLLWLTYKVMNRVRWNFVKMRLAFSLCQVFNIDIINHFTSCISLFMKSLSLPLCVTFFDIFVSKKKLILFLRTFSQIVVISFIPFWLGILEERHTFVGATVIGTKSIIGVFNNAHTASIYLSSTLLFLVFYIRYIAKEKEDRIYNLIIIILGCYFLIHTYVRTGYLMFVLGLFYMLFIAKRTVVSKIVHFVWGVIFVSIIGVVLLSENQSMEDRLMERNIYKEDEGISGSGRLAFWNTSIKMWMESDNVMNILSGHGMTALKQRQYKENGLHIFSHNGFLDALVVNGLVGFVFLISYYILLFRFLSRYKTSKFYRLACAWLLSDISFQMVQGGYFVFYDVVSAIIILLPKKDLAETLCYKQDTVNYI